jgi:hypothetical protein
MPTGVTGSIQAMLRSDKNAEIVRYPWFQLLSMFKGRYGLRSGKRVFDVRWDDRWLRDASTRQLHDPVRLVTFGKRTYWWLHDNFNWDDDGLMDQDVKALVLQRERAQQRKLQTAHSLMRAEESGQPTRVAIPTEIRRAVFERDGGKCVECGSSFDLQYDHILAVARGGATTVENLQLLCADCNRRKSDSL